MEEYYLMWLSRMEGVGIKRIHLLLDYFQSAEAVWNAHRMQLINVKGIPEKTIDAILFGRDEEKLNFWIEELERKEIQFYSFLHPLYPSLLKEIYNPPIGIYVKGTLPAKGIDAMAHKGVLDGGGQTIAVLGCGVDICYPAENRELMENIAKNGCVISEYPPGTEPAPHHFPNRNRIISGLSKIVVVVEAGKKSGTLITADIALESGREVFVVPGNITSALSEGTNNLIKQGCPVVTESNDILFELGITYKEYEKQIFSKQLAGKLSAEEKEIYDQILDKEPVLAETICRKLHKNIQEVQYILSLLEISGYVRKIPQAGYIREG
ncbi:DNA-processing protein DprA [Anaerotignum sp.]|uniref:DNA-processing protein DprA n=1 Tax=Anaerotignum sp. TaxID=2039241 RepID=UPI00289D718E|nr:DNA-processing protein DprA [Anaerotignum sp.]